MTDVQEAIQEATARLSKYSGQLVAILEELPVDDLRAAWFLAWEWMAEHRESEAELTQARQENERLKQQCDDAQSTLSEIETLLDAARQPSPLESEDYSLVGRVDIVIKQRDKYREGFCHALFVLWGDGQQKLAAAEADVKRIMRELGIDWNGEQVAPQAEKTT